MKSERANLAVRLFCLVAIAFGPLARAEDEMRLYSFEEPHMGVLFTLRVWAPESANGPVARAADEAFDRIAELNAALSDYLPESEINDLARAPAGEPFAASEDLYRVFSLSESVWRKTDGAFDVTAGPLVRLWRVAKKNRNLPTEEQRQRALRRTGFDHLALDPVTQTVTKRVDGMLFDFGGIAKGFAADEALAILKDAGFPRSLVAASGDIIAGDPPPGKDGWIVGIDTLENATDEDESGDSPTRPAVLLANRAISTSGDTRRYVVIDGVRYSHIVSTRTGLGMTDRIAASVIAPTATLSDSHATAVALLGAKEGLQFIENQRGIECRIVTLEDGRPIVIRSHGFARFRKEVEEKTPVTAP